MNDFSDFWEKVWSNQISTAVRTAPPLKQGSVAKDITKVLGEDEFHDKLFWGYLVQAGWRKHRIEADGWAGAIQLLLVHEKCGKVIDNQHLNAIHTIKEAERLSSRAYITTRISVHKATGSCKAIPKGEDDEASV